EDGIRDRNVTGVQTCALPISEPWWPNPATVPRHSPTPAANGNGSPGRPRRSPAPNSWCCACPTRRESCPRRPCPPAQPGATSPRTTALPPSTTTLPPGTTTLPPGTTGAPSPSTTALSPSTACGTPPASPAPRAPGRPRLSSTSPTPATTRRPPPPPPVRRAGN